MNTNQDWKPIESAPKDGTPVLLFARLAGVNIHTNAPYSPTIQVGAYRTDLQIWTGAAYRDQREIEIEPVAWVPLPAFPGTAPEAPPLTVTVDPDARGVSVGVYQGTRCLYSGAHAIPAGSGPDRDWELTCDHCNGSGHVFVDRQVAERKTDVQEFKEECECCEGRGFTIAFEDIPGIAEYVKSCRPASTVATEGEKDERQAFEAWFERRGVWPRLSYEEVFIAGWKAHHAPAAGDALDALRELVECDSLKKRIASMQVCVLETDDDVQELDAMMSDLARRQPAAWDAARAAIAQQSQRKEAT